MADVLRLARFVTPARWRRLTEAHAAANSFVGVVDQDGQKCLIVSGPIELEGIVFMPGVYRGA